MSISKVLEVHATHSTDPRRRTAGSCGLSVRKPLPEDEAAWEETDEQRVRSFVIPWP